MAVRIKFLSVVVPIERINGSTLPSGLDGLVAQYGAAQGKSFWHDESLYVEFAMNPNDVQAIVQRWESLGLTSKVETNGVRTWKDLCVVDFYQGPTLSCSWLNYDANQHLAWKKGTEPGQIIGPDLEGDANPLFVHQQQMAQLHKYAVTDGKLTNDKPWWKFWRQ
jgi:hypothetical protein